MTDVVKAANSIDQKTPDSYVDTSMLKGRERSRAFLEHQRHQKVGQQNRRLMEKLHDISKKPGIALKRIESEPWKLPPLSCEHNKAMVRTRQQQKLLFENERICKRLLSIQTTFNRAKDEKEYKRHREAVHDMSKVPPPGGAPPKPQRQKKRGMKLPPLTDID